MNTENDVFRQRLSEKDFETIRSFIESHCGIKLPPNKKQMVEGRLRKRVRKFGFTSYNEYIDFVFKSDDSQDEIYNLIDVITTNKTDFYREPNHFDYLRSKVLPYLIKNNDNQIIKVWSAGCSSGEEPYTLSMELDSFLEKVNGWKYEVHASDISTEMLKKAKLAIYDEEKVADLSLDIKRKYFLRSKDPNDCKVRLKPFIRKSVNFSRFNLLDTTYTQPKDFDAIFCRNVLIYFDKPTQETIIRHLITHIKKGGFLFLGHSETIYGMNLNVQTVAPTVYRKV